MYKEYEVEIKKIQEQWLQLKMNFLSGCNMKKILFSEGAWTFGGLKIWLGESTGGNFSWCGGMYTFLADTGGILPIPPVEKTLLNIE